MSPLFLYTIKRNARISLGEYHSDRLYRGDIRCDLHPRWSPDGHYVTFDSVHEGTRQIYIIDVSEITK